MTGYTLQYKSSLMHTIEAIPLEKVDRTIEWLREARDNSRRIFVCGNGGSAATSSHFVCDMIKGASFGRDRRFRVMALNDSVPVLTAYANDVSYDCVFSEQLKNFAQEGDILISISGSGNSPNVLRAVEYAKQAGLKTIGLTGRDGGKLGSLVDLEINVAEPHMGRIEDAHMIVCHMIGYYFMDNRET